MKFFFSFVKQKLRFINPALKPKKIYNLLHTTYINKNKRLLKKVEVNKDGQIEVIESQDALNAAVTKALESSELVSQPEALTVEQNIDEIEQIVADISETTDITASPTDSYPKNECLNTETGSQDNTGNDSALGESTSEVSFEKLFFYFFFEILKQIACLVFLNNFKQFLILKFK